LRAVTRREVLRDLKAQDRLWSAYDANPAPSTLLQDFLDEALGFKTVEITAPAHLEILRAKLTIADWLGSEWNVTPAKELRDEIPRLQLLEPVHELADGFAGREKEIGDLADYVGVFEASGVIESVVRRFQAVFSLHDRPPLFIHGPGGAGKSTLIAK